MKKTDFPSYMQFFFDEVFPIWKAERDGTLPEYQKKKLIENRRKNPPKKDDAPKKKEPEPPSAVQDDIIEKVVKLIQLNNPSDVLCALEKICAFIKQNWGNELNDRS
jgi:hypothetical protein